MILLETLIAWMGSLFMAAPKCFKPMLKQSKVTSLPIKAYRQIQLLRLGIAISSWLIANMMSILATTYIEE